MSITYWARLVDHMHWANTRTLAALHAAGAVPDAVRLLAHVVTTEALYLTRMRAEDPWPQDFWPTLTPDDCAARITANHASYLRFLETRTEADLERPVRYRNSSGVVFHTPVREMLTHVMLHGEHHRGQIARVLREHGGEPALTDFIAFVRAP